MRRYGEVKALDGHVRDSERLIKRANTTDTLKKALPVSRRLQESRSVLEAEYAVLNEVSAKNAALQAKLRDAQPLLWMDNALVMHRSKKEEERRAGSAWEALDPTETSLLRHRRRLQWEVSRRIARVDRELSSNPPTQRFWHVRERKRREQQEDERRKHEQEREAERRKIEKARRLQRQQEEAARSKQAVKKAVERAKPEILREYEFVNKISEPAVTKETPKEIPLPDFSDEEDKENKPKTKAAPARRKKEKPVHKTAETPVDRKVKQSPLDPTEDASVPGFLDTEEARSHHKATKSPSDDLPLHVQPSAIDPSDMRVAPASPRELSFEPESPRPVPALPTNAGSSRQHNQKSMSSSLGRQILSDYRTMPSVASFGAPPVEAKRLNGDVLRRLFSDLDSDRDGHLNRLETCMALHRLHIDVPAPKIAAFFNSIHTTEATEPRRRGEPAVPSAPPLKQVISFRQFVAFITAAFEQQQSRKQAPPPPQPVRTSHREYGQRPHPHPSPKLRIPPLTPRTSSPSRSQRSPVRIDKTHKSKERHDRDEPAPIVVMQENQQKTIEERVLERLPEYLLPQLLADDANRAEVMVRRSLERLTLEGDTGVDDDMVKNIAEQVMRAFVQQVVTGKSHQKDAHEVDVSGLRGAGLDWETEPIQVLPPPVMDVEEEAKPRDDWWNVLSEEQITSLVREIYSQQQQKVSEVDIQPPDSEQVVEDEVVEDALASATGIPVQSDVAVAAPEEVERRRIQQVAEKAIQTSSIEWSTPAPLPSPPREEVEKPLPIAMAESSEAPPAIVEPFNEGEIARNDVDLSDGEVYGGLKRRILKRANVEMALAHEPQEEDDWLARSSVESGELPRMAFLQRDHHQRLLNVSTSSLESGELEDGAMPVPA
ncbi:hypothetical protein Poli38472_006616 [Pythium oligandrum]|uniref:EF-hand domain-containing protein n=1 Tax=Pythium oligandrum TaxID=41045 RepID=A0A8K1C539_PYTOL|nr:hypothetical protein Poli38472_006616 [Pythium oligandrum]|eukprot:TMW56606.1 hypothetical protein Poli38472_006616 [Pythium oligandrum]